MSLDSSAALDSAEAAMPLLTKGALRKQRVIAWSSLGMALLQSVCSAFAAVDGLRLVIGIGSLALSAGVGEAMDRFHVDFIRIPMMAAALMGALFNLAILLHVRQLRRRPASEWRQKPLTPRQVRMNRVQLALSLTTLAVIGVEEYFHLSFLHSL